MRVKFKTGGDFCNPFCAFGNNERLYYNQNDENNKAEIYNALDELDNMFETKGNKILKVKERCLTLKNEQTKIVGGLGHYIFDLDLFDVYLINMSHLLDELLL